LTEDATIATVGLLILDGNGDTVSKTTLTKAFVTVIIPNWNGLHHVQHCPGGCPISESTGFAVACNAGIDAADTLWIALLNNDTNLSPAGWKPWSVLPASTDMVLRHIPAACCK